MSAISIAKTGAVSKKTMGSMARLKGKFRVLYTRSCGTMDCEGMSEGYLEADMVLDCTGLTAKYSFAGPGGIFCLSFCH